MKPNDRFLRRIDGRFLGGRLENSLKTRHNRRIMFFVSILILLAFGYMVGFASWSVLAPNAVTPMEKALSLAFWVFLVFVTQLQPLLFLSIRSAISWPGQPYDERQQQLFIAARSQAFPYVLVLMGMVILVGLGMLIGIARGHFTFSHPLYGGIPVFLGICAMFLTVAKHTPYLILAWQLQDEPRDEGELTP